MVTIRPVRLPEDGPALLRLDTAFITDRVYRVEAAPEGFALREEPVSPPLRKAFDLADELGPERLWEHGLVAEEAGELVGFAAVRLERWNRRALLWHLYVARERRGAGLGRRLVGEAAAYARAAGGRCLWLEVTSVNLPAIKFYRAAGFALCGLDTTLYAPEDAPGETALYFARGLDEPGGPGV